MIKKTFVSIIAALAVVAMIAPAAAFAHDNDREREDRDRTEMRARHTNEFGVRTFDDDQSGDHDKHGKGLMLGLLYTGTVTAESSSGFTIRTKDNSTFTVNATGATVVEIPRTVRTVADIDVNDRVFITGTKSGGTITASVVYYMPENVKPASAKGTVTTVSSTSGTTSTVTVQNKSGQTATVNITGDTEVTTSDKEVGTASDVQVGAKVKLFGFWDSVLNVFNAIKVRIM